MSDSDKQEPMRPIPDGGLKDAMPAWLKRPPAWRALPTTEERFERTLPEPDASPINPASLVDVSDLPQWLQVLASRDVEPDPVIEHAVEVVQSVPVEEDASESGTTAEALDTPTPVIEPTVIEPAGDSGSARLLWSIIAVLVIAVLVLAALQIL